MGNTPETKTESTSTLHESPGNCLQCPRSDGRRTWTNFIQSYKGFNPSTDEATLAAIRNDMEHLIDDEIEAVPW